MKEMGETVRLLSETRKAGGGGIFFAGSNQFDLDGSFQRPPYFKKLLMCITLTF